MSIVFVADSAQAEIQDIVLSPCNNVNTTYALKAGESVPTNTDIEVSGAVGDVFWGFANTSCTATGANVFQCAGMTVTVPDPSVAVPASEKTTITGTAGALGATGEFKLTVTDEMDPLKTCDGRYLLHVTSDGGGWGDPHITTVDGVHYDFQSAGEFTALREDRFEVQTRQTPVPTATVPGANEYTGLPVCVSIYTAVAARIGSNRVTFQPSLSQPGLLARADAGGMQLRVNGRLVTLTDSGIDLLAGGGRGGAVEGRIVPAGGGAIEITDVRGTQLVITPAFWSSQQKWYLNVNVYQTSAIQGTMGLTTAGWLPALPDGTSLGERPERAQQRYQQLYETFADAWRVTDATSLFDYAPGTSTGTFTLDEWPRFNPQSCDLQGQTSVQPTTPQAAEQACAAVIDPAQKADCIFDVAVTGETGFAQSYEAMQRFRPHGTGFQPVLAVEGHPADKCAKWPRWLRWLCRLFKGR